MLKEGNRLLSQQFLLCLMVDLIEKEKDRQSIAHNELTASSLLTYIDVICFSFFFSVYVLYIKDSREGHTMGGSYSFRLRRFLFLFLLVLV